MTGDGRALLWRITIHGMGGGGREGGRVCIHPSVNNHYSWLAGRGREGRFVS